MGKKCEACGLDHIDEKIGADCPDCGKVYCPKCTDKMSKEHRDLEKLREGDAYTRVHVMCPSCNIEMLH